MSKYKLASENQVEVFNCNFGKLHNEIEEKLCLIKKNDLNSINLLNEVFEKFQQLKQLLNLNKEVLPQYILKINQEKINYLSTSLNKNKEILNPRRKFKFNSVKIIKNNTSNQNVKLCKLEKNESQNIILDLFGIKDRVSETLNLNREEVYNKDVQLCNLVDCTIFVYGSPNTLHILNCSKCKIFSGPVVTSIFINECNETIFQLFCQQLRVHNTKNCTFYLHVTTKAIIEDSTELKFHKYSWNYDKLEEDIKKSNLNVEINNWNKIVDFNWLSSNKESSNWIALD